MYGDIGKIDNDDECIDVRVFNSERFTLDYVTIFRCYNRAMNIAANRSLNKEDFQDTFFDELIECDCPQDEADEIVETFNPS